MYKILLVDDESLELETLQHYAPWSRIGVSVAGTAVNGKDALAKADKLKPDIILTDVRMPVMDGLNLARRIKQADRRVKIVFLSGHNEVEYIKSALNLEAAGYLLKPVDMDELQEVMARVIHRCKEEEAANQNGEWILEKLLVRLMLNRNSGQRQAWVSQIAERFPAFPADGDYIAAVITPDPAGRHDAAKEHDMPADRPALWTSQLRALNANDCFIVEAEPDLFCLIRHIPAGERDAAASAAYWREIWHAFNRLGSEPVTIGVSAPGSGLAQLPELYQAARKANQFKFYLHPDRLIMPDDLYETVSSPVAVEACAARLIDSLKDRQEQQALREIRCFVSDLAAAKIHRNQIIHAVIRLLNEVEQMYSSLLAAAQNPLLFTDHWKEISSLPTLRHIEGYLRQSLSAIVALLKERDESRNSRVIDQVIDFMERHHHLPITVDDIAKVVFLTPNYIRTLFKENTGTTILDYLTKIRMQRAADLLKDKSLKVHEVAQAVGYENVSYFCSVFLKHKKHTPSEYRKLHLQ